MHGAVVISNLTRQTSTNVWTLIFVGMCEASVYAMKSAAQATAHLLICDVLCQLESPIYTLRSACPFQHIALNTHWDKAVTL